MRHANTNKETHTNLMQRQTQIMRHTQNLDAEKSTKFALETQTQKK